VVQAPGANNRHLAFGATGLVESSTSMVLEQATQYPFPVRLRAERHHDGTAVR